MAYSDYNRAKSLSPTSFNDASSKITKAQPIGIVGNSYTGFDGFESGSSQLGWESASNFTINSNGEVYLDNSLQLNSTGLFLSDTRSLDSLVSSNGKKIVFSVKIDNQSGNSSDEVSVDGENSDGLTIFDLSFNGNGDILDNSGVISSWSAGTIYDVEVVLDFTNDSYDVVINGSTVKTGTSFQNSVSNLTDINLVNEANNSGSTVNAFFDRLTYTSNAEDTINAGGFIGIDDTNVAGPSDLAVYDGNDNLIPYEIENDEDVTSSGLSDVVWVWTFPSVAGNWTRDDSVQAQVLYGDGPASSEEDVTGTWNNTGQSYEWVYHSQLNGNGDLVDSSPNLNDATLTGTTQVTGEFDIAREYDGNDDQANAGSVTNRSNAIVSAWFKTSNDFGSNSQIISEGGSHNMIRFQSDNKVHAFYNDGSFQEVVSNNTLNDGVWHHAVLIANETNNIELFIDGDSQGTTAIGSDGSSAKDGGLGAENSNNQQFFMGDVDEAKINDDISGGAEWVQAEFDASPKAEQVFFTQDAATTTTTGQTITTPETQLTQTTEDPALTPGEAQIQAGSPTLLTTDNPAPTVNATNTVTVTETQLTAANPDPTLTIGQTILAPETQLTAANPDPAVTGGATTLNVDTTQLMQTTEPLALNRRLVVGVVTQLTTDNPEPTVSPGPATATIPATQVTQTTEPLNLTPGEATIQAGRPTELTVTTPPLTVTPGATSIQVDTTELTQITVEPALALAIILTGNTEALIQTPNKYALMDQHTFKKDDLGDPVTATLTDENNPGGIDLTGAKSVNLLMHDMNGNNVLDKEVTVTDAENGEVEYQWEGGDPIETSGVYKAEFEIFDITDDPETVPNDDYVSIKVQDDLN